MLRYWCGADGDSSMKIYVSMAVYLYDHDVFLTTHLTKKGALMQGIEQMTEDLVSGIEEEEMECFRPDMPSVPEVELNCYYSEQLEQKFSDQLK